jgi:hypothetical protein
LKDWNGGPHWAQYCPLGQGKVDVPGVLALLEKSPEMKIIMVELDPSPNPPLTPIETASADNIWKTELCVGPKENRDWGGRNSESTIGGSTGLRIDNTRRHFLPTKSDERPIGNQALC